MNINSDKGNTNLDIIVHGQAVADCAMALLKRWGAVDENSKQCKGISTYSGTISLRWDTMFIYPGHANHDEKITLVGYQGEDEFRVKEVIGNPFRGETFVTNLSLYLCSDDFQNKVKGSIGRLKRVTTALA